MVIEPRDRRDELECGCPEGRCSARRGRSLLLAVALGVMAVLAIGTAYLLFGP